MKPKNIDEFLNCLALKGALLRLLLMFLFDNLVAGIIQKIGLFSPSIFKNNSFSSLFFFYCADNLFDSFKCPISLLFLNTIAPGLRKWIVILTTTRRHLVPGW